MGRLILTVTSNPYTLGLGVGVDTCVIVKKNVLEVAGSGMVLIVNGEAIEFAELTDIKNGEL